MTDTDGPTWLPMASLPDWVRDIFERVDLTDPETWHLLGGDDDLDGWS